MWKYNILNKGYILRKLLHLSLLVAAYTFMVSCDGNVSVSNAKLTSTDSKKISSLSNEVDPKEILTAKRWNYITIDLDSYRYDRPSKPKSYNIDMTFTSHRVTGLANCKRFSANYKVNGDELSFSKVHFEEATDLASCKEFPDADNAVNSFLSDSFIVSGANEQSIRLISQEYQNIVILSH